MDWRVMNTDFDLAIAIVHDMERETYTHDDTIRIHQDEDLEAMMADSDYWYDRSHR